MVLSNSAIPKEYGGFRDQVLNGEIPVNEEVSLEMNRIDHLIENPDFYYDDEAIDGFIDFCENEMTLIDGDPVTLLPSFRLWAESALAWFYFAEEKVYNQIKRRYEIVTIKKRLVNKQYLIVGRGAAKSMYAAFLQAYGLTVDTDTTLGLVTAPTMDLSEETMIPIRTAISRARGPLFRFMTQGNIFSNTHTKVQLASTKKGIQNFMTNSLIYVRPMKIDKLQGARTKYNTVDEWLSGDVKEDVVGAIEQGASKIDDYLIVATSSEGTVRDSVGDTIKMELMDILRGDYYAPNVSIWYYRLDELEEVGSPEMWLKANPNLGATVSYDAYQKDVERAESQPATRNDILAKRFGIPVEGFTYFFVYDETLPHSPQNYDGMECLMGADLSQGDDFTAFSFLFPLGNGTFGVKTRSYVSDVKVRNLPRAMQNKYQEFVEEGTLVIMPETILDMNQVYDDLDQFIMEHQYTISGMGYDPYNASNFVARWVADYGEYAVEKVRQGVRTESVPLGELKILAKERGLIFDEKLMKFAMGNTVVIEDNNGNRKLSKKRSDEKIDNFAALMDAWVVYSLYREAFE